MARTVGSFDAKTNLARLLDEVEQGGEVTITRRGRPVARLVPVKREEARRLAGVLAELRELRRTGPKTKPGEIREWRDQGRP
jgi:prevent-host-death family protein